MPINIRTTEEIKDQIVSDIESNINQTVPLLPKAFVRVYASALAGVFTLMYKFGLWIFEQIFPQTADELALTLLGERVNVFRKGSTQAVLEATETGVNGTSIPTGTTYVGSNQIVYRVQVGQTIVGGVATLSLLALTSGEIGNLAIGSTLSISQSIPNIDGIATVTAISTEGEDQESIELYRDRVMLRYQERPQGGSLIDYRTWAKEVEGITRAFAFRVSPGFVTVYPIEDTNPVSRIPSAAKLSEVDTYINDPARRPLQATVFVTAMDEVEFNVEISNLSPDTSTIRDAIDANTEAFLLSRQPKQFVDEQNPKNVISETLLISIATQSGAQSLDLVLKNGITTVSSYTLANNELAKLGTVTYL